MTLKQLDDTESQLIPDLCDGIDKNAFFVNLRL